MTYSLLKITLSSVNALHRSFVILYYCATHLLYRMEAFTLSPLNFLIVIFHFFSRERKTQVVCIF